MRPKVEKKERKKTKRVVDGEEKRKKFESLSEMKLSIKASPNHFIVKNFVLRWKWFIQ